MHIQDGLLNPINAASGTLNLWDLSVLAVTWAITVPFLLFCWKKTKSTYSQSFAGTLAIMSAFVFVIQMLNFPVAGGTTVHVLGGTLLAVILGPWAAMLSLTMVLGMQAFFFADGGLLAFGANAFNMAVVGSLSFFLVKFLAGKSWSRKRFSASVFIASFLAAILTALATGLEIGVSSAFAEAGGIGLTVPTMVAFYTAAGFVEATATSIVATVLVLLLPRMPQANLLGVNLLKRKEVELP